uniref:Uncharacterized protein n=1 Tax=Plectus sambesii TaxID=2011161 RepID=A0A914W602_9BILA
MCAVYNFLCILSLFAVGYAGKVGECRTECAELNNFKIVRVHLRETNVSAGLCQNSSGESAKVAEYICDLKVGLWVPDMESEEQFSFFPTPCPAVTIVEQSEIDTCPGNDKGPTPSTEPSSTPKPIPSPEDKKIDENQVSPPIKTT